ncbi:hypothetical protein BCR42DRAFT_398675 [Absidia repens]|uniref:Uncharacterized protein n=1 Tax=Absidia repens TaxID=90262 RepID=A0A1X2HXI7_9FUNG|nr:hypothetical protein BCR42DRAFT_398675 [Absidia repens]
MFLRDRGIAITRLLVLHQLTNLNASVCSDFGLLATWESAGLVFANRCWYGDSTNKKVKAAGRVSDDIGIKILVQGITCFWLSSADRMNGNNMYPGQIWEWHRYSNSNSNCLWVRTSYGYFLIYTRPHHILF